MSSEPSNTTEAGESGLTYEPAKELGSLRAGDAVEVVDRQGAMLSTQTVKRVGALVVTTACGRRWTRTHGEWVSELHGRRLVSWPFPSIRKAAALAERGAAR